MIGVISVLNADVYSGCVGFFFLHFCLTLSGLDIILILK